jgi:hypothetical protein
MVHCVQDINLDTAGSCDQVTSVSSDWCIVTDVSCGVVTGGSLLSNGRAIPC